MFKSLSVNFFILLVFLASFLSFAQAETFRGGVSLDTDGNMNAKLIEIQKKLPEIQNEFVDLNYTINFKPLSLLSPDELKIKTKTSHQTGLTNNQVKVPEVYEISLSTGKIKGVSSDIEKLETLVQKNPDDIDLMFAYAIELKNQNNLNKALIFANKIVKLEPDFALGHFFRGDVFRNMGKFKEAADEYIYTTQINPLCADAYYNIAKILELLGDRELALDYYKTAYRISPEDTEIRDIILDNYIDL